MSTKKPRVTRKILAPPHGSNHGFVRKIPKALSLCPTFQDAYQVVIEYEETDGDADTKKRP